MSMKNYVDENGLNLEALNDLIKRLEDQMKAIYGTDISVDPNSPDGQQINIFCQTIEDLKEVIRGTFNSFSISMAIGAALEMRVALNGLAKGGSTYTIALVEVEVDQNVTLAGLDTPNTTPFTVGDDTENLAPWQSI